jgi:YVTN family beta-propeller protein
VPEQPAVPTATPADGARTSGATVTHRIPAPGGTWRSWLPIPALIAGLAAVAVGFGSAAPSRAGGQAPTRGTPGVARVLAETDQVRAGPAFAEVNGLADGLGTLWLTGGDATEVHALYSVNLVNSRGDGQAVLPSRLVMNPGDLAVGSGTVWVAVGGSVYRVDPVVAFTGGQVTRAFATLPGRGLVGDVAAAAGSVWLTDTANGRVYRFADASGRLEATVPVGVTAGAMAVGDGGIWVADADAHTVSRISVTGDRVNRTVTVPGVPNDIAASAGAVWVTNGTGGSVTSFSGPSGRAVTIRVGREPTGVAAAGDTVWVANTGDGTLSRISARRHVVVATVPVGSRPYAVAADRQGVWVALLGRPVMTAHAPGGRSPAAWQPPLCGSSGRYQPR